MGPILNASCFETFSQWSWVIIVEGVQNLFSEQSLQFCYCIVCFIIVKRTIVLKTKGGKKFEQIESADWAILHGQTNLLSSRSLDHAVSINGGGPLIMILLVLMTLILSQSHWSNYPQDGNHHIRYSPSITFPLYETLRKLSKILLVSFTSIGKLEVILCPCSQRWSWWRVVEFLRGGPRAGVCGIVRRRRCGGVILGSENHRHQLSHQSLIIQ